MDEQRAEYIKLFKEESSEYLSKLNKIIVELEKEPDNKKITAEVYRIFHTLKGMAASLGYTEIETISHDLEEKMEVFKEGEKRKVDADIIDEVFKGIDRIESLLATLERQEKTGEEASPEIGDMPYLEILLKEDVSLPAARAAVIIQRIQEKTKIESVDPSYEEIKSGNIGRILKVRCAEPEKIIDLVASIDEVETVKFEDKKSSGRTSPSGIEGIRVNVNMLDRMQNLVGELVVTTSQLSEIIRSFGEEKFQGVLDLHSRSVKELQEVITKIRLVPLSLIFDKFPRYVRDLSRKLGKEVNIEIFGADIEVDRSLLEGIGDPLIHLIRNSVSHGIESPEEREKLNKHRVGKITVSAKSVKGDILIQISDDGKGIDEKEVILVAFKRGLVEEEEMESLSKGEILRFLFAPGFTTKEKVDKVSGRGVGLDVVRKLVRSVGGSVNINTEKNKGTTISMKMPLSMSIIKVYLLGLDNQLFALPMTFVDETLTVSADSLSRLMGKEVMLLRREILPVYRLSDILRQRSSSNGNQHAPCVVVEIENDRFAIVGGTFRGSMEAVVKPLPSPIDRIKGYIGITMIGDGRPCLILDLPALRYRRSYENTGS
ncbi:chemotaxis protein CheA [candidate division WOR-3 bacterium]|nr:chemotaxis protein CheA [candidate division WOR-3 bacterium]